MECFKKFQSQILLPHYNLHQFKIKIKSCQRLLQYTLNSYQSSGNYTIEILIIDEHIKYSNSPTEHVKRYVHNVRFNVINVYCFSE